MFELGGILELDIYPLFLFFFIESYNMMSIFVLVTNYPYQLPIMLCIIQRHYLGFVVSQNSHEGSQTLSCLPYAPPSPSSETSLVRGRPATSEPPAARSGCEQAQPAAIMSNPADKDNVRVVVRVRPLNDTELVAGHQSAVEVNPLSGSVSLRSPAAAASEPPKTFTFDLAFGPDSKQVSERTHQTRG